MVHRIGRPDGAQPRPAGRGARAGRGCRRPGPDRRDHPDHAGRRSPLVAARVATPSGGGSRSSTARPGRTTRSRPSRSVAIASGARQTDTPRRPRSGAGLTRSAGLMADRPSTDRGDRAQVPAPATWRPANGSWPPTSSGRSGRCPAARAAQHEDRYLDTSDGALARAGYAARLRQTRGGTVVTVKSTRLRPRAPLARREELEGPADRTAEPRDWPPSGARSLILELCGDAPLRRARHGPPAPPQAASQGDRRDRRAEPRRGRRRRARPGHPPLRRARGRAHLRRRGPARASFARSSRPTRASSRPRARSWRRPWRASAEDDEAGRRGGGDRGRRRVPVMSPTRSQTRRSTDGCVRGCRADARPAAAKLAAACGAGSR